MHIDENVLNLPESTSPGSYLSAGKYKIQKYQTNVAQNSHKQQHITN